MSFTFLLLNFFSLKISFGISAIIIIIVKASKWKLRMEAHCTSVVPKPVIKIAFSHTCLSGPYLYILIFSASF